MTGPTSARAQAALEAVLRAPTLVVPIDEPDGSVVWAKLELQLPSGSTKDRIAARILLEAARAHQLSARTMVVEASSGSTSISFAMLCAQLGLRFCAVMPEGVSRERLRIIERYGGAWQLTPKDRGVPGSVAVVQQMAADDPDVFWPDQFANPLNAAAHAEETGPQLLDQVQAAGGRVDGFVAAVGTGGTLMGIGRAVRAARPDAAIARVRVAGVDADAEQGGVPCGIPGVVDCMSQLLDPPALGLAEELEVGFDEAMATTRELCGRGLPVGPSSGLNVAGARLLARRLGAGAQVATVLCDRMERYFSTELFADLDEPASGDASRR